MYLKWLQRIRTVVICTSLLHVYKLSAHITFIGDNEDNRLFMFDVVIDGEKCICRLVDFFLFRWFFVFFF